MGTDDISGQLSGRAFQESSPARRRREKQDKRQKDREQKQNAPEIEMTKVKAGDVYGSIGQNEFASTPYKEEEDIFDDIDLKNELGGEMVDGTFEMGLGEGGDGLTGEEYFETNPNDTSYELGETDNTNRDLMDVDTVPIDMRSPDVTQIMEAEK